MVENIDISVRNHVSQGFNLIKLAIHNFNATEILYVINVFVLILNNGKHLYTVGTKSLQTFEPIKPFEPVTIAFS